MTKVLASMRLSVLFVLAVLASFAAQASGGGEGLLSANTQVENQGMLQRGAALYMNYCAGCHSLKYLRYSRMAADLDLSEDQVMANLALPEAKFGETILSAMTTDDGTAFFGKAPPDLSLIARSRGVDWIYTYLKSFYVDPSAKSGWNNTVLANASMPHVLWELQGSQQAHFTESHEPGADAHLEKLELTQPGLMSPAEYDAAVRDLTTFLEYAGEPAVLKRQSMGVWVLLFLAFFTLLAWLLKQEYWKDVH